MRYALYILETLAWRLFFSRTLVHCGLRLICCPGNNEKTIQNIRYWALITDELWINHKDFKCTVATVFTNVFERLHKQIKWIRVNNECQIYKAGSFIYLLGNERTLQINVNSINQDIFSQEAADNTLLFLLFLFFPPYQQLKRVFKNVLYLAESIIRTFGFEKMNGLIDEPFNLEGECNKQWNVKISLYKDTVNGNAIYHASPSVFLWK